MIFATPVDNAAECCVACNLSYVISSPERVLDACILAAHHGFSKLPLHGSLRYSRQPVMIAGFLSVKFTNLHGCILTYRTPLRNCSTCQFARYRHNLWISFYLHQALICHRRFALRLRKIHPFGGTHQIDLKSKLLLEPQLIGTKDHRMVHAHRSRKTNTVVCSLRSTNTHLN